MIEFNELVALYAESRLLAEWHEDACHCTEFPQSCATYQNEPYFWRAAAPSSWSVLAIVEESMKFVDLLNSSPDNELGAFNNALSHSGLDPDDFIFDFYPVERG
jgi:hypothetical protein